MNTIEQLTINTIRILSVDAIQKANSGHPGLPLGAAPIGYTVWAKHLKHNPRNPKWQDRDRFILSAGHGSAMLYSLLYLFDYGLSIEDLQNFRKWGSNTPGHPEFGHTVGVETTTGPLGQGIAMGVGMALAESYLAEKFNKPDMEIINHYTYVLAGDGCMMEGISYESTSLAGTLGLGKLIVLYDSNKITIEGTTDIAFRENVKGRFEALGWQVITVEDGNDVDSISAAIENAKHEVNKPSMIEIKTEIGYGCCNKQGKTSSHGEPLGEDNLRMTKAFFGWDEEKTFHVPNGVKQHIQETIQDGKRKEEEWNELREAYRLRYPELSKELDCWYSYDVSLEGVKDVLYRDFVKEPARVSSEKILNNLVDIIPNIIGGCADLGPSTKTIMKGRGDFSKENRTGANIRFGVREHAMTAIANGIMLHGGLRPYVAGYLVFSDYQKPAMRLSALMNLPIIYILTHDSIAVGEDGPTHQPIEQMAMLRSMPNFTVFRPADAKEVAVGWYLAINRKHGPIALILARQELPLYEGSGEDALRGGYILSDSEKEIPDAILMASGSEVQLIYKAQERLKEKGIDVRSISFPSWEIFEEQSEEYKNYVLPPIVTKRLAVEAASSYGWYKYTGITGKVIGIDHYGASATSEILFNNNGFTVENIVDNVVDMHLQIHREELQDRSTEHCFQV